MIREVIDKLIEENKKAFVPYIMCGDKSIDYTKKTIVKLAEIGAAAIEIGVPFSDAVADGDRIQEAGNRAIANGVNLKVIFNMIKEVREETSVPLIIMTYLNPIINYGIENFFRDMEEVKVDGIIIPDLPLEEFDFVLPNIEGKNISLIPLCAITSGEDRIEKLSSAGSGFLYAVTVAGVTGARKSFNDDTMRFLKQAKEVSKLPVLAGFGISTPEQTKQISEFCDGVVIGSKVMELVNAEDYKSIEKIVAALG
ncbi:tryptophan synthase subunit alpha [Clostridium fungisolvens]|uniref:Tryptophan synthase alpha chain n=1 Tax=Clostridium fungisolvens TaxID=1604897 RepID=A0A6V8SDE7_9CLOT|nr:tryptophan synthase subunit alpha [Clostridium fungisolvens]GFP75090.1 Tryptophan synthase alpha chain [Clostridium fungisolvens]